MSEMSAFGAFFLSQATHLHREISLISCTMFR